MFACEEVRPVTRFCCGSTSGLLLSRFLRKENPMKCPLDGSDLIMTERQGFEIDYCPKCRGVWLDRGELDKISNGPRRLRRPPRLHPLGRKLLRRPITRSSITIRGSSMTRATRSGSHPSSESCLTSIDRQSGPGRPEPRTELLPARLLT